MLTKLRLTGQQHALLARHLFPGDGLEAVALAACGRFKGIGVVGLSVRELFLVPHADCRRTAAQVTWSPASALALLERASRENLAIIKIHSHPTGYSEFSDTDDHSDRDFFRSVYGWMNSDDVHASAIMLPGGQMKARTIDVQEHFAPIDLVAVAGTDLHFWPSTLTAAPQQGFAQRHAQLFGEATVNRLRQLAIAVVGCSGTGSPLIEMLSRLGVGRLVLVDPDRVEEKNLNRIYNATREDAELGRFKTEVAARAIAQIGLGTDVELVSDDLATPAAVRAVAQCDLAFGCMDGSRGRALLNRLATYYSLPYFDLGIGLDADGKGGIDGATGAVHYIEPDRSSLRDRRVFSEKQFQDEALYYSDRAEYERRLRRGYIKGVQVERPAVISINTQIAATAVNEFLARLHPYRSAANDEFDVVRVSFIHGSYLRERDRTAPGALAKKVGHGDESPLLGMPYLSEGCG